MNTALNYQPEVLVDTADLSREDWLDYRRLGIGGSDAAAIMGLSPFSTIRDLYFDKFLRTAYRFIFFFRRIFFPAAYTALVSFF